MNEDKFALAACTGMSALGLVSRAAVSDYVEENDILFQFVLLQQQQIKKQL